MNIVIISSQRSGSTWLMRALKSENSVLLGEFFNRNLQPHQKISLNNLNLLNLEEKEKDEIIEGLFRGRKATYFIASKLQEKISSLNKHCLMKIHHDQYLHGLYDTEETLQKSDIVIGLYRKNILLSYISYQKAVVTQTWNSKAGLDKNPIKVNWGKNSYNRFYRQKLAAINWIKNYNGKNHTVFSYEEIHENNKSEEEKVKYVVDKINKNTGIKINFNKNYESYLKKENNNLNYSDHFLNPEHFLRDSKEVCFFYEDSL